jgi:plasmid stabilization system protein ParE
VFSNKAKERLREISNDYQERAGGSVSRKVRMGIAKAAKELNTQPERKPLLRFTKGIDYEIRYTKAWSYKIIFRVLEENKVVRILTIRHDKEALGKVLIDVE